MPSRDPEQRYVLSAPHARHNALAYVSALEVARDPPWVVEVYEFRRDRSLAQNRLYWWWLRHIADHINSTGSAQVINEETGEIVNHEVIPDDLHDWFRNAYLPERVVRINGRVRRARKSTTRLTVKEFTDYLNRIEEHCSDQMDLILPHPPDWYEAMGIENAN